MTAIPALSRLRRASDDEVLAERLEPPYTPLRWAGGELSPPTDVYAEVIDTDANVYTTPIYTTPDPALYRLQPGLVPPNVDFTRASLARYRDEAGDFAVVDPDVIRDDHWIGGGRAILLEGQRINHVPDSASLHTWLASQGATLSPTTLLGLPAVRVDGDASEAAHGAYRATDLTGSESQSTYSLVLRAHPDIAVLRMGGRNGTTTSNTLDIDLQSLTFTRLGTGMEAGKVEQVGPDTYYIEYKVTSTVGAARRFSAYFSDPEGSFDFPDATGLWIELAGLQVEIGPFASSPIITTGDPGTRAADSLTCDLPAGGLYERWYDLETGAVTDTLTAHPGGPYEVPVWRAYTHLLVVSSGRTIADARRIAGVTP